MSALTEDIYFATVDELAAQLSARAITSLELTNGYLERIERVAPTLNCFQTVTADIARAEARAADAEIAAGRNRGALHGVPYGIKDLFTVKGVPTSWGARPTRDQVFDYDATIVTRLREAGAVLLGKLAMVEFAGGLGYRYGTASVSGSMRNPWDRERWTGGSSSGTGAAVAAGLVGFGIGTETWGSILCPSAFCGVTGVRPTYGLVSRHGGMVLSWSFDKAGPMARSASDCRTVLRAIAGADEADSATSLARNPFTQMGARKPIAQLRGALFTPEGWKGGEPEVKAAFERGVAELRAGGLQLENAKLPEFPFAEIAGLLITVEGLSSYEKFFADGSVRQLTDAYAPYQVEINAAVTGADVVKAWRMRAVAQQKAAEFFAQYDVLVAPNFLSVAPGVTEDLNAALPYGDPVGAIGNSCGLPSVALPIGFGKAHMPCGMQVMGAPYDEPLLLDVAEMYQSRTRYHRERPRA